MVDDRGALVGTIAALIATFTLIGDARTTFGGALRRGQLRDPVQDLLPVGGHPGAGISFRYFREGGFYQGEYYFLCSRRSSAAYDALSRDLLLLFIALELVSAPGS